ncbi:MAG: tetratricopeptide repeat protein [Lewinellaceae bacterium]|nr:tetratricopeptide repeat protein [Lewinellaceae bacterium]
MRILHFFTIALFSTIFLLACGEDFTKKIAALEQELTATNNPVIADSLFRTYLAAVEAHPNKHADNLLYLTKAAEIKLLRNKEAVAAVRLVNDGLKNHGEGQDLTEPISLLARIWRVYQHKAAPDLSQNPDDIDLARLNLERNLNWLDSALIRLDRSMGGVAVTDKTKADQFIQIAEGYSTIVQVVDPKKFVELNMKAAGLAKTIGEPNTALRFYYNVAEKLPAHPKAPTALFMMGFIYENDLKDMEKAKSTYEEFLKRYPNDPDYVDDAQNALQFLGIPPEEIIKQFEQNQQ